MRAVVQRIFDVDPKTSSAPLDVSAGNLLGGVGTEKLPTVGILLIDVDREQIPDIVTAIAELQVLTAAFRPIFVMTAPALAATRRYEYPAELLIDEKSWIEASPEQPWDNYMHQRLTNIKREYRIGIFLPVSHEGLTHVDRIILSSCGEHA